MMLGKPCWRAIAVCVTATAVLFGEASVATADVIGIGDIFPFKDDPDDPGTNIPDLPQFGNTSGTAIPLIIVGGTNEFVGGTSTGQMIIDIPSDTNPLFATDGYIGGNILGLGSVNVVGLNSEWQLSNSLTAGWEGQAFLEVAAGARVQVLRTTPLIDNPDVNVDTSELPNGEWDLIFGAWEGSQGFAEIDGFASLLVGGNTIVGLRGQGRIDMTNGSRMITINRAVVGGDRDIDPDENGLGNGYVLVDGAGSRWNVGVVPTGVPPIPGSGGSPPAEDSYDGLLIIGAQGRGTVEVRNKGWVRVETDTVIGNEGGSAGVAVVSGADSLLWSLDDMFVGNAAGTAAGELHLDDLGVARADGDTTGQSTFIGPLGLVEMSGGTLITPITVNNGVIRGGGRVDSPVVTNNGDIRNAADLANLRERLEFTGDVDNAAGSIIESIGGEMNFVGELTNSGQIFGRNAIFRFVGGFIDAGGEMYIDNTIVESPLLVTNSLAVGATGSSTILGSLDLSGSVLDMEIGDDYSKLFVTGQATLGGTVNFTLADDYAPRSGDIFEIMTAGSVTGMFANTNMTPPPGLSFAVNTVGSSVFLEFGAALPPISADFNGDGFVDGADLAIWTANNGLMPATMAQGDANGDGKVDGTDWIIWQQQIGPVPVLAAGNPAAGTVPEPGSLAMAALALAALAGLRRSAS